MPGKYVIEATRELHVGGCIHPIIALTANACGRKRKACPVDGMNDYVTTPVKSD